MFDRDLLADLDAPRDDEPPSLRNDIVDELIDHLQCAFRREVLKDGDETAAEARVLDRFGDPKQLARRLWWQAMRSRIMGKRILSGLQWVVTLVALALVLLVLRQQAEILTEMNAGRVADTNWRSNLTMTLNELRNRLPASPDLAIQNGEGGAATNRGASSPGGSVEIEPGTSGGTGIAYSPALTVKLVSEKEDGPPITELLQEISLTGSGRTHQGRPQQMPMVVLPGGVEAAAGGPFMTTVLASGNGRFFFNDLEPDRYELRITLADGQSCARHILIRKEEPQELTIVCPGPRKKVPILVTIPPLPEDVQQATFVVKCQFWSGATELGANRWLPRSPGQTVWFDSKTGQAVQIDLPNKFVDLHDMPPEDRALFLLRGPVHFQFEAARSLGHPGSVPRLVWPKEGLDVSGLTHVVEPGEDRWELELPQEFLDELSRQSGAVAIP